MWVSEKRWIQSGHGFSEHIAGRVESFSELLSQQKERIWQHERCVWSSLSRPSEEAGNCRPDKMTDYWEFIGSSSSLQWWLWCPRGVTVLIACTFLAEYFTCSSVITQLQGHRNVPGTYFESWTCSLPAHLKTSLNFQYSLCVSSIPNMTTSLTVTWNSISVISQLSAQSIAYNNSHKTVTINVTE